MKKLLILLTGLAIFVLNVALGNDCAIDHSPTHIHDSTNVAHQFYDALIETPKDALIKVGQGTEELIVETPVKMLVAIANGVAKTYQVVVKKPLIIIKEAATEIGHRLKAAGHTLAHGQEDHEHEHLSDLIATHDEVYILLLAAPTSSFVKEKMGLPPSTFASNDFAAHLIIAPPELVQRLLDEDKFELMQDGYIESATLQGIAGLELSEHSLKLIAQAYESLATELSQA